MDPSYFTESSLEDKLAETDESASRNHPTPSTYTANITTKPQPNLRPQLLAQANPNLNNRMVQSIQIVETPEIRTDLSECNDLQLRYGCIIETEGDKTTQVENQLPMEQLPQEGDVIRQKIHDPTTTSSPPFLEFLIIPRPIQYLDFDILGELQNLYIKIPLLQAIQDIPIICKDYQRAMYKETEEENKKKPKSPSNWHSI